jgi:SlyX protein
MTTSNTDLASRIDELEARLAQQDQSVLELSDEVYRQQQHIAQLELQLRHLADRMQESAGAGPQTDPAAERPPHY